jgi:hypothetical protein
MASIKREVLLHAPIEVVWDALRDVGALHTRLVPGFVVDTKMDGEVRIVTFANGMVVREPIISIDETERRVCWTALGTAMTHYNGSFQLFESDSEHTRGVWIADLLPHDAAAIALPMIEDGLNAMRRAFQR